MRTFAILASLVLAACSEDVAPQGDYQPNPPDAGSSGPGKEGDPCAAPSDCVTGLACTGQKCAKDASVFCTSCAIDQIGASRCPGEATNYCLTERSSGANYCGTECSTTADCPSGAVCNAILMPRGESCSTTNACPASDKACTADADCPGGACDKTAGKCRATCAGASGTTQGTCGCVVDSDCPTDTCDSGTGRCTLSAHACDASHPCPALSCEQHANAVSGTTGYCRIGKNCAVPAGLTCADFGH